MTNVKFSRKEFEKSIRITKEVEEKISMFGTPLESIGQEELEIEIFPNRPDLLSLQGYVRSFSAFLGKKTGLRKYKINKPEKNYEVRISRSVKGVRPFTVCAIVKNLEFDDEKIKEIIDIQEKIHATFGRNRRKIAIGIYPLEKISLPIKYEARIPKDIKFIPLEETKEMDGLEILQKHPTGIEYAHLLRGMKKFPVFVDSAGEILSMPPILNSGKTGKITEETKEVFIECSGFDFNVLKKTLNIVVTTLADMGGEIYQMKLNYGKQLISPDLTPEKMKINLTNVNKLLGVQFSEKEIKRLLEKMGYDCNGNEVLIPAWRTDILHEVDLIEDIAIAYGYDNFEPEIPEISTIGRESQKEILKRKFSEIFTGLGFLETSSYHLITKQNMKKMGQKSGIEIEKSKTDYKFLRPNLLCSVLKILSENKDAKYPQKIFEIGRVFEKNGESGKTRRAEETETGISEKNKIIAALTPGNFTDAKQILDYFFASIGFSYEIEPAEHSFFIDGRTGKIKIRELKKKRGLRIGKAGKSKDEFIDVGFIGETHPSILEHFNLIMPIAVFELDFDKIFEKAS